MIHHRKDARASNKQAAAIYQQGLAAFETGRFPDAIELLSQIADRAGLPGTLAGFYLSQAHLRQGLGELSARQYQTAAEHFTAARRINPDSAGLWRYLTICHVGIQRFDLAAAELEKAQETGLGDEAVIIRLAYAQVRDGQLDRAMQTLEEASGRQPARADLRFHLGLLQAMVDDYAAAARTLEDAVALAPDDAGIRQHLGLAYGAMSDADRAVEQLAEAQRLRPRDAYLALLLTMAAEAAEGAGHCVSIGPAQPRTATEVAPAEDPALEQLGEIIVGEPDFVEAFIALPPAGIDADLFATLALILERALERRPDYADLHYHCSQVYARLGCVQPAIDRARRAVEINPRYVQALIQLGRLYAETDHNAEAIERLQEAIDHGGDYADVHFMLGELYRRKGERDRACGAYRRALELNANYAPARRALDAALTA